MEMNGSKQHPIVPCTLSTRFKDLVLTLVIYHTTLLAALEQTLKTHLIPVTTDGYKWSENERLLLSLPIKQGGMSIPIFSSRSTDEFKYSRLACSQLIDNIKSQAVEYDSIQLRQTKHAIK